MDWQVSPWGGGDNDGLVAFDGGGAGTVVADDAAQVLHHGERERGG
jgi:hypothetical protein